MEDYYVNNHYYYYYYRRKIIMLLLMLLVLVVQVKGFTVRQEMRQQQRLNYNQQALVLSSTFQLHMSSNNNNNVGTGLPQQNEFSRTVQPDRIIKSKHNKYTMSITANVHECVALAKRFELINLDNLSADVTLQPELIGNSNSRGSVGIIVQGNIQASVTQRCVRSNELFDIDLNFPIYSIVRPVIPISMMMNGDYNDNNEDYKERSYRRTEPRGGKKVTYRPNNKNIDDIDILELQRILQAEVNEEETDSLMEDESIYIKNGILDVGELIAQLFWLQLDPYPKKPGTEPIQRSITG